MSGSSARRAAIDAVKGYEAPAVSFAPAEAPGEVFGANVFSKTVMQKRLPKAVYTRLMATIEHSFGLAPVSPRDARPTSRTSSTR